MEWVFLLLTFSRKLHAIFTCSLLTNPMAHVILRLEEWAGIIFTFSPVPAIEKKAQAMNALAEQLNKSLRSKKCKSRATTVSLFGE
jgi:hypothetical protein